MMLSESQRRWNRSFKMTMSAHTMNYQRIHLNNEFGSRHLIEDMYSLVYSISYPDLRLFLTSAAQQNIASHKITDSGGIVPDNILPRDQRGKLVVAVADNWNLIERIVDGKRTTHAMTSMLVSSAPAESTRIPRLPKATRYEIRI
ncbi:hypothetical protein DPMN_103006, partial [Dreissena polymorpha]